MGRWLLSLPKDLILVAAGCRALQDGSALCMRSNRGATRISPQEKSNSKIRTVVAARGVQRCNIC
jgi:hypothetical protein